MDQKTAKKIRSKNTKIELLLAKAMWAQGLRYRKNCKDVFGKPDFCFKGKKMAVFCDSEFWHGKKFLEGELFKTNTQFWEDKIKRNIARDEEVSAKLKNSGWLVLRFWGDEINKSTDECIKNINHPIKNSLND